MNIFDDLLWRELIYQTTDKEKAKELLNGNTTLYLGIDPTADSIHIGHLAPYITAYRLAKIGHKVIFLIGETTAKIGDPSGKIEERKLLDHDIILKNSLSIERQIKKIFKDKNISIVNNMSWFKNIDTITFLRDYGKHLNVSKMLSKDLVKNRLEKGISFTEFSYQLLQAIDFYILKDKYNCKIQIGGSDQWGNIVSGIELIRKISNDENDDSIGITLPLIKKSDGTKFGKTSNGNIWIDSKKTTIYDFFQFWLNVSDEDAIRYLKIFTFLTKEEIDSISKSMKEQPKSRIAQKKLAENITEFIHGKEGLKKAKLLTELLFTEDYSKTFKSIDNIILNKEDGPIYHIKNKNTTILDLILTIGISKSKTEARRLLNNNAIRYNNILVSDENTIIDNNCTFKNVSILKKGKKTFYVIVNNNCIY